jgi:N-acetylmuramoyl-L-alanine amidase
VQIHFADGKTGWVANYLVRKKVEETKQNSELTNSTIIIQHNGTNIRKQANIHSEILNQANQGDSFYTTHMENDWYAITLADGQTGYIAGWLAVAPNNTENTSQALEPTFPLQNKKIVIDPGHGGNDNGTTGFNGTLEKRITIQTARSLYSKLKAAGANVLMTRSQDQYMPLPSRVNMAYYHDADAFISIHYDSFHNREIRGLTTYFYHSWQRDLAESVHTSLIKKTNMLDRGIHLGDYYVIRENNKKAILLELGYLSNPDEEQYVKTNQYQELAATGIFEGLVHYFQE